jgi:hypothetical protein
MIAESAAAQLDIESQQYEESAKDMKQRTAHSWRTMNQLLSDEPKLHRNLS